MEVLEFTEFGVQMLLALAKEDSIDTMCGWPVALQGKSHPRYQQISYFNYSNW